MKVKRYIANDVQEAMIKIKSELGKEAVILHTRKIKKRGIKGFFHKPLVEVVAAIDSKEYNNDLYNQNKKESFQNKTNNLDNNALINGLSEELNSMRKMLKKVLTKVDGTIEKELTNNTIEDKYVNKLIKNGVDRKIANQIINIVQRQINLTEENEQSIKNAIKVQIKKYLGMPYIIEKNSNKPKIIFLIGPTGVGKTTTIAKLAAKLSIIDNNNVGLITSDTYRIGAVDQLKIYSEILNIPLSVIYEPNEIQKIISKYSNLDYILVDTAGRNHKNNELIKELEVLVKNIDSPDIFLLISLTTAFNDILSIVESYSRIGDYKLLFTKIDESNNIGNILNTKLLTDRQLSYITTGQSVPDDIEIANIDKIANRIVGD